MALKSNWQRKLGVLDQSPIAEGSDAGIALRNSLELARRCDELGYRRYWLAEHHGTPALACNSPEVLIGLVAATTRNLRVGSGGIMLPHYSPLKVAESFGMLSALFPGRIDLGVGRAAGTSPAVAFALQRDRRQQSPDDFPDQFEELRGYLAKARGRAADLYLLGSSPQSAIWAAEWGLPYVYADFINRGGPEIVDYYRRTFRPSPAHRNPHVLVASWAVCADTDAEALHLSASLRMLMTLLQRGELRSVPAVAEAERFLASEGLPFNAAPGRRILYGSKTTMRAHLEHLADEYGEPDEFLLVNILHDPGARMRSYALIAEEFGLSSGALAESEEQAAVQVV